MNLGNYNYLLPEKNLALSPASSRDSSKLFVYYTKTDKIVFDHFYNLDKYLPNDSFLVLNNTKVLPARVEMKKETGGKVMILFLINELTSSRVVKVMADRKVNVGDFLYFDKESYLKVISQKEHIFELKFDFSREKLFSLLKKYGTMPIPLYLRKTPLKRDELLEKYQTIFARYEGSSAAPTASLHFTEKVFRKIKNKGIEKYFITLHVGLGTFAPLTEQNLTTKKLHEEYYEINSELLQRLKTLKSEGKKLVAVGTTVVRTLESEARYQDFLSQRGPYPESEKNLVSSPLKKTSLFIFPPFDFKMVDILITNFHLPKSSLMMLVEAFLQHKKAERSLVELYNIAIKNNFRFYSFGDSMLIL
ncbi:tRNA preQ1(34) S-adenosylmethionine ribosyltransferase-isomerase QueA [Candidatus Roizmanbacteria bacterium]|nr:tRNA preQ1(34) S-adenosylmethionine ribosyltransferase-isomerase QueA [Candidatus Roizmanbacteria bacterium]